MSTACWRPSRINEVYVGPIQTCPNTSHACTPSEHCTHSIWMILQAHAFTYKGLSQALHLGPSTERSAPRMEKIAQRRNGKLLIAIPLLRLEIREGEQISFVHRAQCDGFI